jgi:hypothetical protein
MSRDVIDIAFMVSHWGVIPPEAFVIAENAYGSVIRNNLENAATLLQDDPVYCTYCIEALDVSDKERLQAGLEKIWGQIALSKRN